MRISKKLARGAMNFTQHLKLLSLTMLIGKPTRSSDSEAGFHVSALQSTLPTTSKNSISNLNNTNDKPGLYFFPSAPPIEVPVS